MRKIKSVRDQVYEHVVHMIRTGELDFGEKVNILELQEVLEVSRPPINEALIQLAADGFLDNIPRKGFFVKALTRKEIDDMFDIITVLDIHVLEKVMDNVTDRNIDMLRMIVSRMDEAIEKRNYDEYYELQEGFHRAYLEFCGNPTLIEMMHDLMRKVLRTTAFSDNTEDLFAYFREANRDHAEIVKCIEKKNRAELPGLMRKHWLENSGSPNVYTGKKKES